MSYFIRAARLSDEAMVTSLLKASYGYFLPASYPLDLLEMALPLFTKANVSLLDSGTYFVAESKDGRIIGCGGWTAEAPQNLGKAEAHLRHFSTHPDYVRMGVGKAIFEECRNQAIARNFNTLACFSSLNAEHFYKSLGLDIIAYQDIPITETIRFPVVFMRGII